MDERLVQFDEKMQKTMNNLSEEFGSIRAEVAIHLFLIN